MTSVGFPCGKDKKGELFSRVFWNEETAPRSALIDRPMQSKDGKVFAGRDRVTRAHQNATRAA